eukprot:GFYU01002537.1.p1 GENE.GFYU01002537.1~~GFYU01002537.1.p1  ORF type:complete len:222 (-),score=52.85 GFYU01002537.1:132-797(-)
MADVARQMFEKRHQQFWAKEQKLNDDVGQRTSKKGHMMSYDASPETPRTKTINQHKNLQEERVSRREDKKKVTAQGPTEEEIEEWTEAYKLFDKDGNGKIDIDELDVIMRSCGITKSDKEIKQLMADADLDGSGTLDLDEFVAMMARWRKGSSSEEDEIKQAFKIFDKDKSGEVSIRELKDVFSSLSEKIMEDVIDELFLEFDLNDDGVLNEEEFFHLLSS